jgi:hypothetical protein
MLEITKVGTILRTSVTIAAVALIGVSGALSAAPAYSLTNSQNHAGATRSFVTESTIPNGYSTDMDPIVLHSKSPVIIHLTMPQETYGGYDYWLNGEFGGPGSREYSVIDRRFSDDEHSLILTVQITPISNGESTLTLMSKTAYWNDGATMEIPVIIDVPSLDRYQESTGLSCSDEYFGSRTDCTYSSSASGPGAWKVTGGASYVVTLYAPSGGNGWRPIKKFRATVGEDTDTGALIPIKSATKLKYVAKTQLGIKVGYARAFPRPIVTLSMPGAAIVGTRFTIAIKTSPSLNGTCFINGDSYTLRNGRAQAKRRGVQPGLVSVRVNCTSSGWASGSAFERIYIRS